MENGIKLRLSHSQKTTYLRCARSWEFKYLNKLSSTYVNDKKPMLLGSAFHAGIASALKDMYTRGLPAIDVKKGVAAVRTWVLENTVADKTRYYNGLLQADTQYYTMMQEVGNEAIELIRYYLPRMEFGSKWVVMGSAELFNGSMLAYGDTSDKPLVESEFECAIPEAGAGVAFRGYIDAILKNVETGEIVIFDWKVRGMFPYDSLIGLDDQLYLYAAMLGNMGVRVDGVCQYQIRSKLPAVASISDKSKQPNTGGERGFDTTKEQWLDTCPHNVYNREAIADKFEAQGKFKPLTDFLRPVHMVINSDALRLSYLNLVSTAETMLFSIDRDTYPAVFNTSMCKGCEFADICRALQYGGNPQVVINQHYRVAETDDKGVEGE